MTTVIAFDPGKITGVAAGSFSKEQPLYIHWAKHVTKQELFTNISGYHPDVVVIEEFKLKDNNFRADLSGVRLEGVIECMFSNAEVVYRPPSKKSQVPDQILKDSGEWRTGKDVDWTDGRDANDAIIHLIGYVAFDLKHRPTLRKYFR